VKSPENKVFGAFLFFVIFTKKSTLYPLPFTIGTAQPHKKPKVNRGYQRDGGHGSCDSDSEVHRAASSR
jgi:hypothetical protein